MIEYGIVEEFRIGRIYLIFKKLLISSEITSEYQYARVYHFKKNIEYSNKNDCFTMSFLKHKKISGVNYNLIFKLDFFDDRMGYEQKFMSIEVICPGIFKYYIISLKEQV